MLDTRTLIFDRDVDAAALEVRVLSGPDAKKAHAFGAGRVVVGSSPAAQLRLTDRGVSRIHCELGLEAGGIRVVDLGSKNGCWLGGARVRDAVVPSRGVLQIGESSLELSVESKRARQRAWRGGDRFCGLIGRSEAMHGLFADTAHVAATDETVLIRGESGTGKELLARALHEASPRAEGPFVVLDCAGLSPTLAEAELFGWARGAFTGADRDRPGLFEIAHAGTLFLDELLDLPLELQPKLLRALERREIKRLGETQERRVDVRFVAAVKRDVAPLVNRGAFREDLYFRLAVLELALPPLARRLDDVPLLCDAFLDEIGVRDQGRRQSVHAALAGRADYPWPGNVRELRSFVRSVALLGVDAAPIVVDLRPEAPGEIPIRTDLGIRRARTECLGAFDRAYVEKLLSETGGNVAEAARRAGLHRSSFYELLDKHDLRGS